LATRGYVRRFAEELRTPGPRIPITPDAALFRRAAGLGEELLKLHTSTQDRMGQARCSGPEGGAYPTGYVYDAGTQSLRVGETGFAPVTADVWGYAVSGYPVVRGWLRRRLHRQPRSELDTILPETWTLSHELLELLWLVEATLRMEPELDLVLDAIVAGGSLPLQLGRG
jgi:hypothetical protein